MIDVHPFLISGPEADGKELSALPGRILPSVIRGDHLKQGIT